MTNDQINQFTSPDVESSENLEITVESLKSKVNQLETRISEFEKGKKKQTIFIKVESYYRPSFNKK
jgi:predicted  nucleic acid-binding Zn-ribbon protein